jgi:hypothetical protein
MNSGPEINDRLIASANASPFRPFTVSLTLGGNGESLHPKSWNFFAAAKAGPLLSESSAPNRTRTACSLLLRTGRGFGYSQ